MKSNRWELKPESLRAFVDHHGVRAGNGRL
jgi:hypothetical protein